MDAGGIVTGVDGLRFAGATAIVIGLVHAVFRFLRWAVEFSCERVDMRDTRVSKREADYENKIERRLNQLEEDVALYRRVTVILNGALARIDPGNPVLTEVAMILARSFPIKDQDLIDKLRDVS